MTTIEGNKLIAEFMGYEYSPESTLNGIKGVLQKEGMLTLQNSDYSKPYHPEYHSSWDWLMPVVEKIEENFIVSIWWDCCEISAEKIRMTYPPMIQFRAATKIEATWSAVIDFITWRNSQKH